MLSGRRAIALAGARTSSTIRERGPLMLQTSAPAYRRLQMANPDLVKQFAGKLLGIYTGGVLTNLIDTGYQVGLFEASKAGPATSAELSDRAGRQANDTSANGWAR